MRTLATFAGIFCLLGGWSESAMSQSAPALAERSQPPKRPADGLNLRVPEVRFHEIPLDQALDWLIGQAGCNASIRWSSLEEAGINRDRAVSLQARNLTVRKILWLVLREAASEGTPLAVREEVDLLVVSTRADLDEESLIQTYSVADLLLRVPKFAGPRILLNQANSAGGVFQSAQDSSADAESGSEAQEDSEARRLAGVIRRLVSDFEGEESGGLVRIETYHGSLIVRAPQRIHQLIGGGRRTDQATIRRPLRIEGGRP